MSSEDKNTKTEGKNQRPNKYAVLFKNDDFTPAEFVSDVMVTIFGQTKENAAKLAMQIHQDGKATVGTYTYEVAETKAKLVLHASKTLQFPLKCEPRRL